MKPPSSPKPAPPIGPRIRDLRRLAGLSQAALASQTGVSEATLSRIETGKSEATAAHLYRLAAYLQIEIGDFFTQSARPIHSGARSITRSGDGVEYGSEFMRARVLCTDLSRKIMHPFIDTIAAHTVEQAGGLNAHAGEEFLYVLTGYLTLHTEAYEPLLLSHGDSIYFDASQPHAYVNADRAICEILVITSEIMSANPKEHRDDQADHSG